MYMYVGHELITIIIATISPRRTTVCPLTVEFPLPLVLLPSVSLTLLLPWSSPTSVDYRGGGKLCASHLQGSDRQEYNHNNSDVITWSKFGQHISRHNHVARVYKGLTNIRLLRHSHTHTHTYKHTHSQIHTITLTNTRDHSYTPLTHYYQIQLTPHNRPFNTHYYTQLPSYITHWPTSSRQLQHIFLLDNGHFVIIQFEPVVPPVPDPGQVVARGAGPALVS